MAPGAWHHSRMISAPLGQLAGEIALYHLEHGRRFLVEKPPWFRVVYSTYTGESPTASQCCVGIL
eukprot:387516-Prorocentrum_lima.AAC.1